MSAPTSHNATGPSRKTKPETREKWERWLAKREKAGTRDEPLLIFPDDEEPQRAMRYHDARLQKYPGRNIMLFESTEEAMGFIHFCKEKQLSIGCVITDFDNGRVSAYTGNQVLETAIEYEKATGNSVTKVLISSLDRALSPTIQEYNASPAAMANGKVRFINKHTNSSIVKALKDVPRAISEENEHTDLIPDLIHNMRLIHTVLGTFRDAVNTCQEKLSEEAFKDITRTYEPVLTFIENTENRIEDLLKVWALIKNYEYRASYRSGLDSPNPDSQEPEEAINIRILGALFSDTLKGIRADLGELNRDIDFLNFPHVRDAFLNSDLLDPAIRSTEADHITHNLKNPIDTVVRQINDMAGTLREFTSGAKATIIRGTPGTGKHGFTHDKLRRMVEEYEYSEGDELRFYYVAAKHSPSSSSRTTTDRDADTPGAPAPKRYSIDIPRTKEQFAEAEKQWAESGRTIGRIDPDILGCLKYCIHLDQVLCAKTIRAQQDPDASLGTIANQMINELDDLRRRQHAPG